MWQLIQCAWSAYPYMSQNVLKFHMKLLKKFIYFLRHYTCYHVSLVRYIMFSNKCLDNVIHSFTNILNLKN